MACRIIFCDVTKYSAISVNKFHLANAYSNNSPRHGMDNVLIFFLAHLVGLLGHARPFAYSPTSVIVPNKYNSSIFCTWQMIPMCVN